MKLVVDRLYYRWTPVTTLKESPDIDQVILETWRYKGLKERGSAIKTSSLPRRFHEFVLLVRNQEGEQREYFASLEYVETSMRTLAGLILDLALKFPQIADHLAENEGGEDLE